MKKILPIFIIGILLISTIGATAGNDNDFQEKDKQIKKRIFTIEFQNPKIVEKENDYLVLNFDHQESYILNPGQPMLPRIIKTFELPFGVKNIKVEVEIGKTREETISKEIKPAPSPLPLSLNEIEVETKGKNHKIYSSSEPFPLRWFSYHSGCGLDSKGDHVTHLVINLFPIKYKPLESKIIVAESAEVRIEYEISNNQFFPENSQYEMVIITPRRFSLSLKKLVNHKNNHNVPTILKTTEEIYREFEGRDKPEKIKYFIKDALENWDIDYVLLVGGLKSLIYGKPRDTVNHGSRDWYLPVRYANNMFFEPGFICDHYFADIYKTEGGFDDWDSNNNDIFAEWYEENDQPTDIIDLYPDVTVGRLPCRNLFEVRRIVKKIIYYETNTDPSWYNSMLVVSGDGFLDQEDLNIKWNTNELPDGEYTIYAQSNNPEGTFGPVDIIPITLDRTQATNLTFNHDDHLKTNIYPFDPIAEIVSVSPGNNLGNTPFTYTPNDGIAYCNDLFWWANISYEEGILIIRGKSYDPKPYGNRTDIHIWIKNELEEIVFEDWKNDTKTYYEGEWVTGEKEVNGRAGALSYISDDFEKEILWTSNGKLTGQELVIEEFSKGYGLIFFSGHGSPTSWGDHNPGIPGNRRYGSVDGLLNVNIFQGPPYLPMNQISNENKYSIVVVGGCHNSQFNISTLSFLNFWRRGFGWVYQPTPECWSWYLTMLPKTGAIATVGNTGLSWGWEGEFCTIGAGDGWISAEFFKQYGENNKDIIGEAFREAITSYVSNFKDFTLPECYWFPDQGWDIIDEKSIQQWVLLGDPSLKMGGYQ